VGSMGTEHGGGGSGVEVGWQCVVMAPWMESGEGGVIDIPNECGRMVRYRVAYTETKLELVCVCVYACACVYVCVLGYI